MTEIRFYGSEYPAYRFLSNFYMAPFELDGKIWPSTEHYYQAMKATDPAVQEQIRTLEKAYEAKQAGGKRGIVKNCYRSDWDQAKNDVMRKCLRAKFAQPTLRQKLLDTGDAKLIEASPSDYYWGEGAAQTGDNWLGVLLVELREELKKPQAEPDVWDSIL